MEPGRAVGPGLTGTRAGLRGAALLAQVISPPCPQTNLQLLRIEEELGDAAVYAGENYRHIAY